MSLEIAVTDGTYAIVVSDGLAWNNEGITDEWAKKQIRLGPDIAVAAGGKCIEVAELFQLCQNAFDVALDIPAHRAEAVRKAFESYVGSKPFADFGETILGGLLVIHNADGFQVIKQNGDYSKEAYQIEPGNEPQLFYLTPTSRIKALCFMFEREILEPMRNGAPPAQIIANLRALYHAAAQLEDPPKSNENLRIAILGDVPTGEPCEPDKRLASNLNSFVQQVQEADVRAASLESEKPLPVARANNAICADGVLQDDSTITLGASTDTQLGTSPVAFTSNGGVVDVWLTMLLAGGISGGNITIKIWKGSVGGTLMRSKVVPINPSEYKDASLLALDQSPGSGSVNYYASAYATSVMAASYITMIAGNRKK